jgi:hypothetical protein
LRSEFEDFLSWSIAPYLVVFWPLAGSFFELLFFFNWAISFFTGLFKLAGWSVLG